MPPERKAVELRLAPRVIAVMRVRRRPPASQSVYLFFLHLPLASLRELLPCLRHIFKLLMVVLSSGSRHFPAFSGVVEILLNLFHAVRFPIEKIASALCVAQRGLCGADRSSH
jgi:hypothetical protein